MLKSMVQRLACSLAVLSAFALVGSAAAPSAFAETSGSKSYCFRLVSPHTDCASMPGSENWINGGDYYENLSYYPGAGTVSVCEHVYWINNGNQTVSDRCANNSVSGELYTWRLQYLSLHAGNNSATEHTINAYGYWWCPECS
jgi:hypothetical protein